MEEQHRKVRGAEVEAFVGADGVVIHKGIITDVRFNPGRVPKRLATPIDRKFAIQIFQAGGLYILIFGSAFAIDASNILPREGVLQMMAFFAALPLSFYWCFRKESALHELKELGVLVLSEQLGVHRSIMRATLKHIRSRSFYCGERLVPPAVTTTPNWRHYLELEILTGETWRDYQVAAPEKWAEHIDPVNNYTWRHDAFGYVAWVPVGEWSSYKATCAFGQAIGGFITIGLLVNFWWKGLLVGLIFWWVVLRWFRKIFEEDRRAILEKVFDFSKLSAHPLEFEGPWRELNPWKWFVYLRLKWGPFPWFTAAQQERFRLFFHESIFARRDERIISQEMLDAVRPEFARSALARTISVIYQYTHRAGR